MHLNYRAFTSLFVLLLFLSANAHAQMFSIDSESESRRVNRNAPQIRIGLRAIDFNYTGATTDNNTGLPVTNRFDTEGTAVHISFESPFLEAYLSVGNKLSGMGDDQMIDFSIALNNNLNIITRPRFRTGIPLLAGSQITTIRKKDVNNEFSQSTIRGAAGAYVDVQFGNALSIYTNFMPGYGFSSSAGGFFGGTAFTLEGKLRINFLSVFKNNIISIGYDFNQRSYDIDREEFDYDLISHMFTIGVSL
ncbi:hypothetical protein AB2B38_009915 [Balneola sp. MJW-20]|uniref:hypothetical protein n=1 Tax=Gracilimonas aurantiaca TaxID=3234185 RepID=UPI0034676465